MHAILSQQIQFYCISRRCCDPDFFFSFAAVPALPLLPRQREQSRAVAGVCRYIIHRSQRGLTWVTAAGGEIVFESLHDLQESDSRMTERDRALVQKRGKVLKLQTLCGHIFLCRIGLCGANLPEQSPPTSYLCLDLILAASKQLLRGRFRCLKCDSF